MKYTALACARRSVFYWQRVIERHGSLLNAFSRGRAFKADTHYPAGDWVSSDKQYQGFYHCHRFDDSGEHGHMHLFKRFPGLGLVHLFAVGFDVRGVPISFFNVSPDVAADKGVSPQKRADQFAYGFDASVCLIDDDNRDLVMFVACLIGMYLDRLKGLVASELILQDDIALQSVLWTYPIDWVQDLEKLESSVRDPGMITSQFGSTALL